jgi:opacity protein-like surface antigen
MATFKALIIAGGAFFALAQAAVAADLLPPAPPLEPLPPAPVEFNGWYLRGDVGGAINANTPSVGISPNPLAGLASTATNNFYNPTISASGFGDIGFGYQVNSWFRADVTGEYRGGATFQTLEVLNDQPNQYSDFYRANLSSYIAMVNGYVDLGTWYGVTPYVGAGVGVAYNMVSGMTDNGIASIAGSASPAGGYFSDGNKTDFAWALMAGLSFNVTQNLKLDVGYRYLDYGKFTSGGSNCLSGNGFSVASCGGSGYAISSRNTLATNDFRIGLRWMIGEEPAYAPPPEAPLVRKY